MQKSNWGDRFSYTPMADMARFLTTYNMGTQTLAVDTLVYAIQTSGTGGQCTINGVFIPSLDRDAEHIMATAQPAPTTTTESWELLCAAGVTSFVADDEVYTGIITGISQKFYKCLVAHDCVYGTEPANNPNLWQAIPNIDGLSMADHAVTWAMVTAEADGTLGVWIASEAFVVRTADAVLKVPYFDPSIYCVIAFVDLENELNNGTGVVGSALIGAGGIDWTAAADATVYNIVIGPVFPHPDNMPKN